MSQALTAAGRLKPEIRLAQAVSEFEADLSGEQKAAFRNTRAKTIQSSPNTQDVMRLAAEIDRASGQNGRCLGPRLMNLLQAVQKFAALGDVIVGGSQNLIACGIWTIVRTSLQLLTTFSSYLEKLSMLFMKVGRSAPRFESMALLYPRSRDLQSSLCEYFIVVVHLCHEILRFTRKSNLKKFGSSLSDSNLTKYQSDLESWGSTIKEEVGLLMAARIEDEANRNSKLRGISSKFFGIASNQQKVQARQRVLDICTKFDHMVVWKQIRKAGNTNIFRQCPHYQRWISTATSNSLIYTGKLGAGKSVLLANIVDALHLQVQDEVIPVAFFFVRHDVSESLRAQTVLGSIARQLLERVSDLTKPAELLERINNMDPPEKVFALLQSALQGYRMVVVIDGIDELSQKERELLIQYLHTLQRKFAVSLCVSLRQDANDPLKIGSEQLSTVTTTSIPENTSEIELFISRELQRCIESKRLIVGDISLLLEIQETLTRFSQGMFLWVALQIESLCAMETDEAISQALKNLPKGLSETFGRILKRSQTLGHSYQKSILELVTVAQRPLTLEELREALSVAPGDTKWSPARLLNNIHGTLACCGSLVIIDEEELTLRLVHHSVKQYLLEEFKDSTGGPITSAEAHTRMSDIIVTYLNYPEFDRQLSKVVIPEIKTDETMNGIIRSTRYSLDSISSLALKLLRSQNDSGFNMAKALAEATAARFRSRDQFLFRNYAMLYWQSHVSQSLPLDPTSNSLLGRLFDRKALDPITMTDDEASLLLLRAAETGNLAAVEYVISSNPDLDVDKTRYQNGQTALHAAAWYGSESTIRFLLLCEPNGLAATDFDKNTPLDLAIIEGHVSLVKVFVDHCGSDPRKTHLLVKSLRRHLDVTGSNFNFDFLSEVLLVGACNGNQGLIRMFLDESRVDLVLRRWAWSAIYEAVRRGDWYIVELLLEDAKIPRLSDREVQSGCDPLQQAVKAGNTRIVKALIGSWKLNIDSINQDGKTALYIATELRNLEMVELLGSYYGMLDSYAEGIQNQTPLQAAPFSKHGESGELMAQHLLSDTNTNLNIETGGLSISQREARCGYIPFHYVAENGDTSMASALLESDPSLVHKLDHFGRTPLHLAAMKGHLDLVKLILAIENVDLFPIDDQGYSPRDYGMQSGNAAVARLLS